MSSAAPTSSSYRVFLASIILCVTLTVGILFQGFSWSHSVLSPEESTELKDAVRTAPGQFWSAIRASRSVRDQSGRLRGALAWLADAERDGNGPERNNALIARADLLFRHGYPEQALVELNRAMEPVSEEWGRTSYWWLKAELEHHLGLNDALASSTLMLLETGYDADEVDSTLAQRSPTPRLSLPQPLILPFWIFLLLFPSFHLWLTPAPKERSASSHLGQQRFGALRLGLAMIVVSTILIWVLRFPNAVFPEYPLTALLIHLASAYTLILYPAFRHDRGERQTTWSFPAFARFVSGWLIILLAMPLVFLLSWLLIREMALKLPFWAVLHPAGPALGLPALSGFLLLLLPWGIPLLLGWRSLRANDPQAALLADLPCPVYLWDLPGSRFANALTIGYLSPSTAIGFTQPLLDGLTGEQIRSIARHEVGHVHHRHLLLYFLVTMPAYLIIGLFSSLNPLGLHRHLVFGPSLPFALALILGFLLWLVLFASISRRCEQEADRFAATDGKREIFLRALTRLYELNLMTGDALAPAQTKLSSHPGLQERKRMLRETEGQPVFPTAVSTDLLLIACWRARLALEWKGSLTEATNLVAFEFDSSSNLLQERIAHCADRHAQLGSECLILPDAHGLDVLFCAQKNAV
ncbi:MAG TPA: M48 family metalloprotease, partial [Candidatus Ozemobacteraceae bacterium]|nr:M48 family metalloprotease [Candidatus Ozemobacteraceae bacterium]